MTGSNPQVNVKTYTVKDYTKYLTSQATVAAIPVTSTAVGSKKKTILMIFVHYFIATMGGASSISLVNSSVQAETSIQFDFILPGAGVVVATGLNASIMIEYPSGKLLI